MGRNSRMKQPSLTDPGLSLVDIDDQLSHLRQRWLAGEDREGMRLLFDRWLDRRLGLMEVMDLERRMETA